MNKSLLALVAGLVTLAASADTYYMVGSDTGTNSSYDKSYSTTIGWSTTPDGPVDKNHNVSADHDYVIPSGVQLRAVTGSTAVKTFKGKSLTLSGTFVFKDTGTSDSVRNFSVGDMIAAGGIINDSQRNLRFHLQGGLTIPEGQSLQLVVSGKDGSAHTRRVTIDSTVTGAGTIFVGSTEESTESSEQTFAGDMSKFTGVIDRPTTAPGSYPNLTFTISGAFGGSIKALDKAKNTTKIIINYDGLVDGATKGLKVASTTIPAALVDSLTFYGSTDFTTTGLPLMTFPAGTQIDTDSFAVKFATSATDTTLTPFSNLYTEENGDGTITLKANKAGGKIVVAAPQPQNFTYDGEEKETIAESPLYVVKEGGVIKATAAGEYSFTLALPDPETYMWQDDPTGADKNFTWEIAPKSVSIACTTTFPYDGNAKTPIKASADYTLSGDTSATNEGVYTVVATLKDAANTVWSDNTTEPKTFTWSIAKTYATADGFLAELASNTNRVESSPFATGGLILKVGKKEFIHVFTNANEVETFHANSKLTARMLLVAGGGSGGGSQGGGGGGAGGMVETNDVVLKSGDYAIQVGKGGHRAEEGHSRENGSNSSISNALDVVVEVAIGGGAGGHRGSTRASGNGGNDGGSGGGSGNWQTGNPTPEFGFSIAAGQGFAGGAYCDGPSAAAGGGGAGSPGCDGASGVSPVKAGDGGRGRKSDILGYDQYFAGGGGGALSYKADNKQHPECLGLGGLGGGGQGAQGEWGIDPGKFYWPGDGVNGLGGGGGGSGTADKDGAKTYSGAGGNGIVIIRYTAASVGLMVIIQ